MKKLLALLLCFTLMIVFAGCGGESPDQAVNKAFDALKAADIETASQYISYDELTKEVQSKGENANVESEQMLKLMLKNLKYKIISSTVDGDSAAVKAEITNTDMSGIIADFIPEAFSLVFSGLSEEQLNNKYMEIFTALIDRPDNKTVTKTVEIKLSKHDSSWKINVDDELADAIFGGMISTADRINDSFGGDADDAAESAE